MLVTPIGFSNIGGNFFWIWAIVCALFVPIAYFFGVETSGRTLEQVDQLFFDNPRVLMGLDPVSRQVFRAKVEDIETVVSGTAAEPVKVYVTDEKA